MSSKKPRLTRLKPKVATLPTQVRTLGASGWRRAGAGSTERGYTYAWQKAREQYLRAHPLCVMCEAEGRVTAGTIVDHRIPHRGDQTLFWDKSNLQTLCKPHHDGEKQRQERELGL